MTSFRVVRGRFPSDIEEQLNKLGENYHPVDVQCMTYDHNINQYTMVCRVGQEVLPCTYYNPLIQLTKFDVDDNVQELPTNPKKTEWIHEKCNTNIPPETL